MTYNSERAQRATQALAAAGYENEPQLSIAIAELSVDLRHLMEQRGLSIPQVVASTGLLAGHIADDRSEREYEMVDEIEYEEVEYEEIDNDGNEALSAVAPHTSDRQRQSRPLEQQSLCDFDEFLQSCDGLTFVFLAASPERVHTTSPDVVSAIALAVAVQRDIDYEAPYSDAATHLASDWYTGRKAQIAEAIQARVQEMERQDAEFVLLWYLVGDTTVRVAGDVDGFADSIVHFLQAEVGELLRL